MIAISPGERPVLCGVKTARITLDIEMERDKNNIR